MENKKNVFIKQKLNYKVSVESILGSIPGDNYDKPQDHLALLKIEWRWRIIKIDNHTYVEISQKDTNKNRLYINNECKWVQRNISDEFDKYVDKTIYAYLSK
jgi:hypothetical protein